MPLYEFQCKSCGHEFEDLVLGSARPACPSCNGQQLERLLSVFAVNGTADDPIPAAAACGSCGDPRGPGACSIN
ncbi:MAG: zinc ribbon domain-containing protein [Deltaproteobacteria bacterium]|nr:zinc ribbon domain-containing protein [Deltaproteobacteria bacterium]